MRILNIDVPDDLLAKWRQWYAPGCQVFRSHQLSDAAKAALTSVAPQSLPLEIRDTFGAYGDGWGRIDEVDFWALSQDVRAELLATHEVDEVGLFRWPSELAREGDAPLIAYVADTAPSRHEDVPEQVWEAASALLPDARRLSGTFAETSGPNCFGTVMTAAGEDVERDWVKQPQFEEFLARCTQPADMPNVDRPGVVWVWRNADGLAVHACVTVGGGFALNKPAQAWWAPRYIWTTDEVFAHHDEDGLGRSAYAVQS